MDEYLNHFEDEGYFVISDFLSKQEASSVLNDLKEKQSEENFKKAGIGKQDNFQIDNTERGDFISWIDKSVVPSSTLVFLTKIEEVMSLLNRNFYLGLRDYECHYTEYPEGTFYKKHVDRHKSGSARIVSFVLYLNDDWTEEDGGQLLIYNGIVCTEVIPAAGKLVVFLSEKEHEVLPTKRVRNSITGWMLNELRF